MILFREATEDVYAGVEWRAGTAEARKVVDFLVNEMGMTAVEAQDYDGVGIGIMKNGFDAYQDSIDLSAIVADGFVGEMVFLLLLPLLL